MFSNFVAAHCRATYKRHVRDEEKMSKHQGVLQLLEKLGKDASTVKTLDITHLEDLILYISAEKDILVMIQAADISVENDHKPAPFHEISLYAHVMTSFIGGTITA